MGVWDKKRIVFVIVIMLPLPVFSESLCHNYEGFSEKGWRYDPVREDMKNYMRDHRMAPTKFKDSMPPDAIGKDYYQWLWGTQFGAAMRRAMIDKYCQGEAEPFTEPSKKESPEEFCGLDVMHLTVALPRA